MGLRAPAPRSGTIHSFPPQPPAQPPIWRHRLHNALLECMVLAGAAAAVYGFLIHPLMRHYH
jgi:hypothetical protein